MAVITGVFSAYSGREHRPSGLKPGISPGSRRQFFVIQLTPLPVVVIIELIANTLSASQAPSALKPGGPKINGCQATYYYQRVHEADPFRPAGRQKFTDSRCALLALQVENHLAAFNSFSKFCFMATFAAPLTFLA
jgi:hypothetical protein